MAKSIMRIDAKKPDLLQRKRVAAYARVSMDTERLMHSLSVQVSYYSELIQNTPGWEYAGVYAEMCPPTMIQMHPPCTSDAP